VVLGDVALREHEIVALNPADVDLVLVEGLLALGAPLFADDDREHSVVPRHSSRRSRERLVTLAAGPATPKKRDPVHEGPPCYPSRTMAHCVGDCRSMTLGMSILSRNATRICPCQASDFFASPARRPFTSLATMLSNSPAKAITSLST
jgi:hypothetical protein